MPYKSGSNDQTVATVSRFAPACVAPLMTIMIGVGTGGFATPEYVLARQNNFIFDQTPSELEAIPSDGIEDSIDLIKSSLKMTMTEIAACIGVTRQAIYGWKSGATIKTKNARVFDGLRSAAMVLAEQGEVITPYALRRTLPGGKSLFQVIASGGDGALAATALLGMLQSEESRRQELAAKFKGQTGRATSMLQPAPVDAES